MNLTAAYRRVFTFHLGCLDNFKRRRRHQRALKDALAAFESSHQPWVESCFDLPFLLGRGAEALEANDARALARAWTLQFRYRDETRRDDDVRRLVPAAEAFITLFGRATLLSAPGAT